MESSSLSKSSISSSLQQREQERRRQVHSFRYTVPIALVLHLGLVLVYAGSIAKNMVNSPPEEVEIIVEDAPKENSLESGGNGGGGSAFLRFQGSVEAVSGNVDGNNIAVLGNPFFIPESSPVENIAAPIEPDLKSVDSVTEALPEVSQETKPEIKKKPEEKSQSESKPDPKPDKKTTVPPSKLGQFDSSANGKGSKGDRNTGRLNSLNSNAANGAVGKGNGNGLGNGTGSGNGLGSGNGSGNGFGNGKGAGLPNGLNQTKLNQKPSNGLKPIVPVVMNPTAQPNLAKKGPKCIENCGLSEYLGAEGTLRISQEIGKDGTVIPKLLQSSGDLELDRKALEAVSRRKYEASEDGGRTTIRVTSQQEGSDFQRQQDSRRQQQQQSEQRQSEQRQSEQDTIARERALQEQENRKPIKPELAVPEPIPTTVPSPVVPVPAELEPLAPAIEPIIPESVAPAPLPGSVPESTPEPVRQDIAPVPLAPESIASPGPEPVTSPTP